MSVTPTRRTSPGGFPYETEFWLFARLAHTRRREFVRELRFSLIWHDDPNHGREVWNRLFQTVTFRPGVTVRDLAAPFSVVFEGPGRYEIQLWYPVVRRWDQSRQRRLLARTHIRIEG